MSSTRLISTLCVGLALLTMRPMKVEAQHVHAQAAVVVGGGYYYQPYFYTPFYWGWYPPYPFSPAYPFYPYPAAYWYGPRFASARIQVTPKQAEVYIDGYYVGRVDDFDGVFQRLDVPPGQHEIEVYLQGYREVRQKILFRPGEGYKLQTALEPLPAGEAGEPRPNPSAPPAQPYAPSPGRPTAPNHDRGAETGFGTLTVRVQPSDAVIEIDGERWDSPEGGSRLVVELPAGTHRVEVRKDGFRTYSSTVTVRVGATETLNVSLSPTSGDRTAN